MGFFYSILSVLRRERQKANKPILIILLLIFSS